MCIDIPQAACDMPEPKNSNVPPPTPLGVDEWNSTTRAPVRRESLGGTYRGLDVPVGRVAGYMKKGRFPVDRKGD